MLHLLVMQDSVETFVWNDGKYFKLADEMKESLLLFAVSVAPAVQKAKTLHVMINTKLREKNKTFSIKRN